MFRRKARLTDDQLAEVSEAAGLWIRPGFTARREVATAVMEYLELEPELQAAVDQVVDAEWQARLAEQAQWTAPGDHARVAAAFGSLGARGVVARMNFTCCQTCGSAEIGDERTSLEVSEGEYPYAEWAYTFFHQQDAERLGEEPADLFLTYSTFRAAEGIDAGLRELARSGDAAARQQVAEESDLAVGRLVAEALTEEGLTVDWNGEASRRIAVTALLWRKPLPQD